MQSKMFVKNEDVALEQVEPGIQRQILGYDSELMMVRVVFEKGAVGALHNHPHRQVSYVEYGSFEITINGEKSILSKGDSFMVPPDSDHGAVALEAGCLIDVFNPVRNDFLE
jgi:quercetin dioxygenase-like cupin family protein